LSESTEETSYLQKVLALARSSGKYVQRLWRAKIDFSRFSDFMAPIFSSIYSTLAKAVTQAAGYSETMRKLYLNRLMFIPPFNLLVEKPTPSEEELAPIQMGRANVAFLFNVTMARKNARKLTERLAPRTPKPAATATPAPLLGAEVAEEGTEETATTVPEIVATFHGGVNSKVAPSMKGMTSVLRRYHSRKLLSPPLRATPKPLMKGTTQVAGAPSYPLAATAEKEAPQLQLAEGSSVTFYPQEMDTEILAVVSIPVVQFGAEAARSVGYATGLPSMLMQHGSPVLANLPAFPAVSAASATESAESQVSMPVETQISMPFERLKPEVVVSLNSAAKLPSTVFDQNIPILSSLVLSTAQTPETTVPRVEPSSRYAASATFPSMGLSPLSTSLREVFPYLTSLAHSVSRAIRATVPRLSAVPTAASTAAKFVMRTLLQRVSSVEAPSSLTRAGFALSRPKIEGKPVEVEAFRLPQIVSSLLVGLSQEYPLLSGEAEIGEALASTVDLTAVPEETLLLDTVPEVKTVSKLSTAIALASSESLIAQRLQQEPGSLTGGLHVARSLPAETFGVGAFSPARAAMVNRMVGASAWLASRGKPAPWGPSGPPRTSKLSQVQHTVQNTFNITLAEAKDADLRDLERKINRILSEQIRRYYGSTKI
jgi:hypothetical protein